MRRLLLALLFPLLLIAQQGAFVHGLQHLAAGAAAAGAQPATQDDRHPSGDQYCDKCFAFAHIGAAADLPAALATLAAGAFDAIGFRLPLLLSRPVGIPRSRGPPAFL